MSTETQLMQRALDVADGLCRQARDGVLEADSTPTSNALLDLIDAVKQLSVAVGHAQVWMAGFEDLDDQRELAMDDARVTKAFAGSGR